jgi:pyruvate-formate lyase-activating enzyme
VASAHPHFGEETPLVGRHGSGTIFFSRCNLLCAYCQNWPISHGGDGALLTHHRSFRDELRHRLTLVESLVERCPGTMSAGSQKTGLGAEEFTGGKVCQSQLRKSSCGEARSTTSRERLLLYRLP